MQSIDFFQEILLYFIAFMIGNFAYFSISALSIFIIGEIIGYKFASFNLWGFQFIRENKEVKFRSTKFTLFPSLMMFPPEIHSQEKKVLYECAPLFLGLLAVVMGSVGIMWMPKGILRTILAVTLFALLLNFIVHFWNLLKLLFNMYGKGPESIFWRENERVNDLLKVGVQPKEIEFFIPEAGESFGKATSVRSVSHWNYDFKRYYKALQWGKYDEVAYYIKRMESVVTGNWVPSQTLFYYEIIYYYTAIMRDVQRAEKYFLMVDSVLTKDMDINGRRVYAAYLYYTGKNPYIAMQVAQEGLNVVGHFPMKGLAYMERDLILQLMQRIQTLS